MMKVKNYKAARLVAASAVLLVVVISGSTFFFIARGKGNNTNSPGNGRVTPIVRNAAITPIPTILATPQPLFFDNFTDKSKGWYLGSVPGYTRVIDNNSLLLADANHKILTESLPSNTTFDDFMVTVTFTLLQANHDDSVGLYLRGDSNLDHDYRIDIYGNNSYAISKEYLDADKDPQVQYLVPPIHAASLKPVGQQNMLTAMAKGPTIVLLINGKVVNSVTDTDYTKGQIALFLQNSQSSSEVDASFSSVSVYPAPDQLPSR